MGKLKRLTMRLLFPHPILVCLLALTSSAGLVYVFRQGMDTHPIAYVVYVVSFYALCTVVARIPGMFNRSKAKVYANPHAARYLTEQELRIRISLYSGTALNLAFGIFKLVIGITFRSVWFGAVGVYYMVLSLMRYLLVKADRSAQTLQDSAVLLHQWKGYRTCGALLLLVNATMTGIVSQIIWQNRTFAYPGYVIYVSAAYTFYRLTMAVIQTVKMRKGNHPLFAAAKATDLSVALMSIFTLQTAMFASFGGDMSADTQQLMNSITGSAVCFAVVCMAVFMLIKSQKNMKLFQTEKQEK